MKTVLTKSPKEAAQFIKNGGIVAFPTETVYGLGASVFNEDAIKKIFLAKKRPADNPLIAHVADLDQISLLAQKINKKAREFIAEFFPGPITLVLPKSSAVPEIATAGLNTIGVRMPRHRLAQKFLEECGVPLVAPSANLSGKPSPTSWEAVHEDLDGRIDCILKGETTEIGLESTVVDCSRGKSVVLRQGSLTLEEIRKLDPVISLYQNPAEESPRSPGLKHRHYKPHANVIIISDSSQIPVSASGYGFIGLNDHGIDFKLKKVCDSVDQYAKSVFEFFRECDRQGIKEIFCEQVEDTGIGAALMDRIGRASGSH